MPRKRKKKEEKPAGSLELPKRMYIFWSDSWTLGEPYLRCVDDMRDTKDAPGDIGEYLLIGEGKAVSSFVPKVGKG